ncbi:MAG: general secretion pathway protein GspB [Burkholderiales bacterium]|nr:general secretion pathway protein GspB [Burkholderiales bacterium]
MSYILDALRKADADRERDPSRGIHAHPVAVPGRARHGMNWPVVAGGLGGLAVVAAAAWLWPSGRSAPTVAAPAPVVVPAPAPAPVLLPAPPPPEPVVAKAPVAAPVPAPAAAPAASAAERIHAVSELPAEVQRELPKLPISGGVYSDNASQRMLIVGGQVANEGAEVAPGLVLEQIRPKSAVLRFRGFRYSVAY